MAERRKKIHHDKSLTIVRKCKLLNLNRSTLYYRSDVISPELEELIIKKEIDKIHMKFPFMGSRSIRDQLKLKGHAVNRKRVQRLMREMGIRSLAPSPNTSKPGKGHKIYPYLLKNLTIDHSNQVWATDITYIPMPKGFLYLVAVIDWYSRKVLSWRLSNSMESEFCIEAVKEAITKYGKPCIFNTDQGSQFTSTDFTDVLKSHEIKISMDGKGRWVDNVFVERLWRSLKYEEVYLKAYESATEAREEIGNWFKFYNQQRTHQSLDRKTPDQVYLNSKSNKDLAA